MMERRPDGTYIEATEEEMKRPPPQPKQGRELVKDWTRYKVSKDGTVYYD